MTVKFIEYGFVLRNSHMVPICCIRYIYLLYIDWLLSIPILFTLTFAFNAYPLIYIFLRL